MGLLANFIGAVGLDQSFFYQLALAGALYFISKRLFLQPYIESADKRRELTKGRIKNSQSLEEKIEKKKILYEQKAKKAHQKFQEIFNVIKKEAQDKNLNEALKIQAQQKQLLEKERENLSRAIKEQETALEKDLPLLADLLAKKIKGEI